MEKSLVSNTTISFGFSLAVCALINAALVILKEKNRAVRAWMQKATGHHWITHSAALLILFFLVAGLFGRVLKSREPGSGARGLIRILAAGVVIGSLAIAGFYAFR
ncbi:MAG TPA: hypothetical protein VHH88_05730 [Verrucomicrobiae bacterium]|nr:hypothetical protein [Verrucomicrobiae bacterium]